MKITEKGLKETYQHLVLLQSKITDLHPVFQHILKDFLGANRKQFESEGFYLLGENWTPLDKKYAKYKKKKWGNKPILVASGKLKKSLTELDPELNEVIIENTSFKFISKVKVNGYTLWKLHHYGTKYIPSRPIIDFDRFKQVTKYVIKQYIYSKSKGGFGKEL